MRKIRETIEQFHMFEAGDRVIVGLSGGPDSVALLHMLWTLQQEQSFEVCAVHVNHMLRPEANDETENVKQLAEQLQIPLKVYYEDVLNYGREQHLSFEQAGHELRFQCFEKAAEEWNCNKLALGHHKGDVVETVLMHFIQGCGMNGLISMPAVDGRIVRPVISYSKSELVEYCLGNNLHFDVDSSNMETECFRNKVRLELLPQLEMYNPRVEEAMLRMQDSLREENDYLQQEAWNKWCQYEQEGSYPAEVFRSLHPALQKRLLQIMWENARGNKADLSYLQLEKMVGIAKQTKGSQRISLAHDMEFFREYQILGIRPQKKMTGEYSYIWDGNEPFLLPVTSGIFLFRDDIKENRRGEMSALVDFRKLKFPLEIRNRREGDRIPLPNLDGEKKLKKFFVDKKIPATKRQEIPLVVSEGRIVWIPGLYLAESVMVTSDTEKVAELSYTLE